MWSGIEDSNLRPYRPERYALPGCANPRKIHLALTVHLQVSLPSFTHCNLLIYKGKVFWLIQSRRLCDATK